MPRARATDAGAPRADGDTDRVLPEGAAPPASLSPDVFAAAVNSYVSGQRLDMQSLARRLGVGRATLYRRAGNREQILDEVIWWRTRHVLVDALREHEGLRGVDRIMAVTGAVLQAARDDHALRAFLDADPETALRILTGAHSAVQRGMSTTLERLLEIEIERKDFACALDVQTLAYAVVRIGDGFLYSDIIADRSPDADGAMVVIEALLRGLDTAKRSGAARPRAGGRGPR